MSCDRSSNSDNVFGISSMLMTHGKDKCEDRIHECFDTCQRRQESRNSLDSCCIEPIGKVTQLWLDHARLQLSKASRPYRLPRRWLGLGAD